MRKIQRRAPAHGYDFGNKRQYRRAVWAALRDHCAGRMASAQALLMPSAEGDEIEVALANGFREQNLHIVDHNAAIVASLKRRYPRVHTYGVSLEDAIERLWKKELRIDVANLDLCGPVSVKLAFTLKTLAASEVMRGTTPAAENQKWAVGRLAVTVLRGREQGRIGELITGRFGDSARTFLEYVGLADAGRLGASDCARVALLLRGLTVAGAAYPFIARRERTAAVRPLRPHYGIYRSTAGNQTMLWVAFDVVQRTFDNIAFGDMDVFEPTYMEGLAAEQNPVPAVLVPMAMAMPPPPTPEQNFAFDSLADFEALWDWEDEQ